jgi:hypothetical protein
MDLCVLPGTDDANKVDAKVDAAIDACTTCTNNDLDGDGIPNASDNCPTVANANQANEDGDAFGDACDLCPPFADQGEDADHDGVGDLCDPSPMVAGDKIIQFWGFSGGLPPGATVVGTITAASGDATVTAGSTTSTLTIASTAAGHEDVWAEATLDADNGGAIIGVVTEHQPATDNGIACQLVNGGTPVLRIYDSNAGSSLTSMDHAFAVATRYQLHVRRNMTNYLCNANSPTLQITASSSFAPTTPEVGIRVRTGTARYHWVMATTSP